MTRLQFIQSPLGELEVAALPHRVGVVLRGSDNPDGLVLRVPWKTWIGFKLEARRKASDPLENVCGRIYCTNGEARIYAERTEVNTVVLFTDGKEDGLSIGYDAWTAFRDAICAGRFDVLPEPEMADNPAA